MDIIILAVLSGAFVGFGLGIWVGQRECEWCDPWNDVDGADRDAD